MIKIYEPIYADGQELTEPAFTPLDVRGNNYPAWREFRILTDMYRRGLHRRDGFTGLFSPKFRMKTKVSPEQFMSFVEQNGDADVCLINMAAHLSVICFNAWTQGEFAHPGLTKIAQGIVTASNVPVRVDENVRHGAGTLCYSNFWVGSELFWERYVGGILIPIADFIERNEDSQVVKLAFEKTTHSVQCEFLPFVVERLFSTFLQDFSGTIAAYPMDPMACCINDFEREIVQSMAPEIEKADEAGEFSSELKKRMQTLSKLRQMYTLSYYSTRPHPHTGQPLKLNAQTVDQATDQYSSAEKSAGIGFISCSAKDA